MKYTLSRCSKCGGRAVIAYRPGSLFSFAIVHCAVCKYGIEQPFNNYGVKGETVLREIITQWNKLNLKYEHTGKPLAQIRT